MYVKHALETLRDASGKKVFKGIAKEIFDVEKIAKQIYEAMSCLGVASQFISKRRKEFLRGQLTGPYKRLCNDSNPVSDELFGSNVQETIKEIAAVQKVVKGPVFRRGRGGFRGRGQFRGKRGGFTYAQSQQSLTNLPMVEFI